jgi:flagellar biosynthesis protein FliR
MNADLLLPWLVSVGLLSVRLTVAIALSPPFASHGVPATVRVILVVALAALTVAGRGPATGVADWVADPVQLILPMMAEVFVGALLGMGVHVVLAAFALAGRLLDVQIGFAIGSIFDPVTRTSSNVLASMMSLLSVTLFFLCDAHLALVHLVTHSLDVLPLGELPALDDPMRPLLAAGSMFSLGLALAAPVAMALLLTDVAVGVASRNLPQINVLMLSIPIKIIVGYAVLAVAVKGWAPLVQQAFGQATADLGRR